MDLVLRALVLFFAVYLLLRVVGRRELSQMEPVDLVLLIVLGDAVQQGLTQDDYSVTGALIVMTTIAVTQVFVGFIAFRFKRVRSVLEGEPVVLIDNGELLYRNLRRVRISPDELAEEARQSQIASLEDVEWGICEPSGKISFIPKKG
jgi:uncharacterized membrane protein YcaP (DUF421 family)